MISEELAKLLKECPPMTAEQMFEQRVSFVYGQLNGKVSKEDVRRNLQGIAGESKCPRCHMSLAACKAQSAFPDPEPFF